MKILRDLTGSKVTQERYKMLKQRGFTLIELMIVVAIVGVLSAVAIPSYKEYVASSHGANAMNGASNLAHKAQACIQTGVGCDNLNVLEGSDSKITFSTPTAKDTAVTITYDNSNCSVDAVLTSQGTLAYTAVSTGIGTTDPQCELGAGL